MMLALAADGGAERDPGAMDSTDSNGVRTPLSARETDARVPGAVRLPARLVSAWVPPAMLVGSSAATAKVTRELLACSWRPLLPP